jgi:hypothetical protein
MFLAAYLDFGVGGTDIAWWHIRQITPAVMRPSFTIRKKAQAIRQPARGLGLSLGGFRFGAFMGLIFGILLGALFVRLQSRSMTPTSLSLTRGCEIGGLVGVLTMGVAAALEAVPGSLETATSPKSILSRDRKTFCVIMAWASLIIVLLETILLHFAANSGRIWQVASLVTGLLFFIIFGLNEAAWWPYIRAKSWLALRGALPWPLMNFLEDAHRRGVLRQVGAVYQFRHIDLQHRLAERYQPPAWFQARADNRIPCGSSNRTRWRKISNSTSLMVEASDSRITGEARSGSKSNNAWSDQNQ